MKIVLLIILAMIVASLFLALFTLVKDKGQTNRTVRALTMRVVLSVGLIALLLISYKAGLIKPNQSPYMYINESGLQAPK